MHRALEPQYKVSTACVIVISPQEVNFLMGVPGMVKYLDHNCALNAYGNSYIIMS